MSDKQKVIGKRFLRGLLAALAASLVNYFAVNADVVAALVPSSLESSVTPALTAVFLGLDKLIRFK